MTTKLRNIVKFPALVQSIKGVGLSRANGIYTFGLDYSALNVNPISAQGGLVAVMDPVTGEITASPVSGLMRKIQVPSDIDATGSPSEATALHGDGVWRVPSVIGGASISLPQHRLTLTSGVAVLGTSVAAATTIFSTPCTGKYIPIYDGTNFAMIEFGEVSQSITDTTKSPFAVSTSANYDMFWWVDSDGTKRCTRGYSWNFGTVGGSDTARGTGAFSNELEWINGIPVNKYDITNGPAARRGTYAGTIRTNSSSTVDYIFGGVAAGGNAGVFNVWNAYNRVPVDAFVADSTDSWTQVASSGVWRAANSSNNMAVFMVRGLDVDPVRADYCAAGLPGASTKMACGIGIDTTSPFTGSIGIIGGGASVQLLMSAVAKFSGKVGLGAHIVRAIEVTDNTPNSTWYGDSGNASFLQTGLHVELWA